MAVYKNREVTVMGPQKMATSPSSIMIQYKDGTYETVSLSQVQFTDEEKKALVKQFPSEYENVVVISDADVKSIQEGKAPEPKPAKDVVKK